MSVHVPGKINASRLTKEIRKELERLKAPRGAVSAIDAEAMKPETGDRPFTKKGWVFELKYDGYRILAEKTEEGARLAYRSGRDATRIFPEIIRAVSELPFRSLLLDGEAVILDLAGRLFTHEGGATDRLEFEAFHRYHAAVLEPFGTGVMHMATVRLGL